MSYRNFSKAQALALEKILPMVPGVASVAYYPKTKVFQVFLKSATKHDLVVIGDVIKQQRMKK